MHKALFGLYYKSVSCKIRTICNFCLNTVKIDDGTNVGYRQSRSFPGFQEHLEQDESGVCPQMRLATSKRSFNESYPLSILRSSPDTCVNLICIGTSEESSHWK
ncbi:hypothetical protein ACS0PU_009221 [Formica fusca]